MTKADLQKMFLNKNVKITYEHGKHNKVKEEVTGICLAIHETQSTTSPFDIELDSGVRYGFSVQVHGTNYCEGKAGQGTRKIEVVK